MQNYPLSMDVFEWRLNYSVRGDGNCSSKQLKNTSLWKIILKHTWRREKPLIPRKSSIYDRFVRYHSMSDITFIFLFISRGDNTISFPEWESISLFATYVIGMITNNWRCFNDLSVVTTLCMCLFIYHNKLFKTILYHTLWLLFSFNIFLSSGVTPLYNKLFISAVPPCWFYVFFLLNYSFYPV